ncbi:DUF3846 domain-containing protein [Leifsonia sp. NPDC102414]|uniref:DUF3846 domain-containing protein n=1 Tax=Leifsonia sp. NPDC102414 TaxID=3364124 RepID=UPI0038021160
MGCCQSRHARHRNGEHMLSGVRIDLDGTIVAVKIDDTTSAQRVAGMKEHIGCALFDVIRLPENIDVWVDDEGLYRSEHNPELTGMVRLHQPDWDAVFGRGLVLGVNPSTGDTVSLSLDQMASVVAWWRTVTTGGNNPAALRRRLTLV